MQKRSLGVLALISVIYFILFIPPNLIGARDANMLALFEVDEYAFYPNLVSMLTPGDTLYQTLRNFLIYNLYTYGYPFFFFSALSVLPVKLLLGANWLTHTPTIIAIARQMTGVLPTILALLLLVYAQTRFRSLWKSVLLYLLLLCVPGVVGNNLFWHPDGLSILFLILTGFLLVEDNLRFGRRFYLAGLACGLAVSVKNQGLFFFLTVPLYLVWGLWVHQLRWPRALRLAGTFVLLMLLAIVVSNPLLLLPNERAEVLGIQVRNIQQLAQGFMVKTTANYVQLPGLLDGRLQGGDYPDDFRIHYGELAFVLLCLSGLLVGLFQPRRRLSSALWLSFLVPLAYALNTAGTRRTHYFLPLMLPLVAMLFNFFDEDGPLYALRLGRMRRFLTPLVGAGIAIQAAFFIQTDAGIYTRQMQREADSQSLAFYRKMDAQMFSLIPANAPLQIYRDWRVYVPQRPHWRLEFTWDLANYALVDDLKPDVLFLEQENIKLFTEPGVVEKASDPDKMRAWQNFYGDALHDRVPGYQLFYQDHFGLALVKRTSLPLMMRMIAIPEDQAAQLGAYQIDENAVPNALYLSCVRVGACLPPTCPAYQEADNAAAPVTCVDQQQAAAFCQWAGKRLPGAAELQKASDAHAIQPAVGDHFRCAR